MVEDEERYETYFDMLDEGIRARVKHIEEMRESVHRERQGLIKLIENTVKDRFSVKQGNGYVGIKVFGSIATDLAIETSDVDIVVTGLRYGKEGNRGRE